jgi:hypothetical protein
VNWMFVFGLAVYNLVRIRHDRVTWPAGDSRPARRLAPLSLGTPGWTCARRSLQHQLAAYLVYFALAAATLTFLLRRRWPLVAKRLAADTNQEEQEDQAERHAEQPEQDVDHVRLLE